MANSYTVEDFQKKLQETGLNFSDPDMKLALSNPDAGMSLISAKQAYGAATTSAARALANAQAEKIRSEYGGYTGGGNGSGFTLNTGADRYIGDVSGMVNQITNRGEFQFDPDTNPLYQAYQKQYHREGERAAENTLGIASAATGGIPSSYAVNAAAQANNYYAAQAADKLPELQNMLFGQWATNGQLQQGDLSAILSAQAAATDRVNAQNSLDQFAWQKDMAEREFAANQAQQAWQQALAEKQFAADQEQNTWEQQYKAALAKANAGDYSALNALLNISGGAAGNSNSSSSTSSSSSSSSTRTPSVSYDNGGYSTSQIKALQSWLGVTADGQFGPQSQAAMKARGYSSISQAINAMGSSNTQNFMSNAQEAVKQAVANKTTSVSAADKAAAAQAQRRADTAGGVVQSQADWDAMVKVYGEGAVKAAYRMK